MKKIILFICSLLLISCIERVSTGNPSNSEESSFTSSFNIEEISSFSKENDTFSDTFIADNTSSYETTLSSNKVTSTSQITTSTNKREDSKTPLNKNNKIVLGSSNNNISKFEFYNGMPNYFRPIYGYNYAGDYYASGSLKISSDNDAKQGFQTAMFVSNKRLEIRFQIGEMHGKQTSKYDNNKPILVITGFDENGNILDTININSSSFTSKQENGTIRQYMYSASSVAYLEVIAEQLPYEGGKSYNFGFKGIDLIAWPYE